MDKSLALILCVGMLGGVGSGVLLYEARTATQLYPPLSTWAALSLVCAYVVMSLCTTDEGE
jgi:uncharacterized iron-regulated membrane protein